MKKFMGILLIVIIVLTSFIGCASAEFEVSSLTVKDKQVVAGESVTVEAITKNIGGADGIYNASLMVDGQLVDSKDITITAGTAEKFYLTCCPEVAGEHTIELGGLTTTVTVLEPAEFQVGSLVITPTKVTAGEPVTVKADVTNIGGSEGIYTASLKVNDIDKETKDIVLDAGATKAASFTLVEDIVATYNLEIAGQTGTLKVLKPAEFELGSLIIEPGVVVVGSPATTKVDVTNVGEAEGTYKATLEVNNVEVETKEVTLDGGEMKTVSFDVIRDAAGIYDIEINKATGTLGVVILKPYNSPKYGYSISYISVFRIDTSDEAYVQIIHPLDLAEIVIDAEVLEEELTLEEYYQADIEKGKNKIPSLKVLSTKKVREAEALPGYEVDFTLTKDGTKHKGRVLYMVSGRLGFGVGIVAEEELWDTMGTVYDIILQSFVPPSSEFNPPPVTKITEATMAKGVDSRTGGPVQATATFKRNTPEIYCVCKISGVAGTKATALWVLVKGDGITLQQLANISLTLKEDIETPIWAQFSITPPPQGWWVGDYMITIYLNDELVVTLPFMVKQ